MLLLALAAVAVSIDIRSQSASNVYVNQNVVIADSAFTWLPDDSLRSSWGSREAENGKWGFVSQSAPFCPVSQVSGSIFNIFDGDINSGFVWKTVSLNEKCPVDSINCVEKMEENGIVAHYNQAQDGKKCTSSYCENLSASVVFDTEKLVLVQSVAMYIQNSSKAPRSWRILYSFEDVNGPFVEYNAFTMDSLTEGLVNVESVDGSVVAARYWKIEITSNWGDEEVELKEVRLFGRFDDSIRRLAASKEVTVDGFTLEASDYVLKYNIKGEAPLYVQGYTLSVVRVNAVDLDSSSTGDKHVFVAGQSKTFRVSISNHENTDNDRVKYVIGNDCSAQPFGEEMSLVNGTFTVSFSESTEEVLSLCYRLSYDDGYEMEDYFLIPGEFHLYIRDVVSITALSGANDFAVKNVPKTWRADVLGASVDDMVGFMVNGECVMTNYAASGFTFTFTYDSVEGDEVFPLCYKFVGEEVSVFDKITVRVGHLDSMTSSQGSPNVLITDFEKSFTLTGSSLGSGDKLFLTAADSCAEVPALVSEVDENLTVNVSAASSGALHVCYKYASESAFFFSDVVVNGYAVSMTPSSGAVNVLIVEQSKTYTIAIDGPDAHLFTGFMTLAMGSCSGDLIFTSGMTNTISVSLDQYRENMVMCYTLVYNGVHEPAKMVSQMSIKEFWNLKIENSSVNYMISETAIPVHAYGYGIEDDDTVFFVSYEVSCSVESSLVFPIADSVATVVLPNGSPSALKMCYRFGSELAIDYDFPVSAYGVNTDLNGVSFKNMKGYFHLTAIPEMTVNDKFTFVKEGSTCPTALSSYTTVAIGEWNEFYFESETISNFVLCYHFAGIDRTGLFGSAKTLVVDKVESSASDGYKNIAFTFVSK